MRKTLRMPLTAVLATAAVLVGNVVRADIIPVFNATAAIVGGTQFSYNVVIPSGSKVKTGDYFTIYDFHGYIAGSAFAPVDWTISEQLTGITPSGIDPSAFSGDDPTVINLTFEYTGAPDLVGEINPVGGVGAFGADSTFSLTNDFGTYAANSHKHNPGKPDDDTNQQNAGFVVTPNAIPEASTLMILLPGLVPLGVMLRKRASKS